MIPHITLRHGAVLCGTVPYHTLRYDDTWCGYVVPVYLNPLWHHVTSPVPRRPQTSATMLDRQRETDATTRSTQSRSAWVPGWSFETRRPIPEGCLVLVASCRPPAAVLRAAGSQIITGCSQQVKESRRLPGPNSTHETRAALKTVEGLDWRGEVRLECHGVPRAR